MTNKPEDLPHHLVAAFNAGDLAGVIALYEPDARHGMTGENVASTDAFREVMNAFLALNPSMNYETTVFVQAGDIAFTRGQWSWVGKDAEGNETSASGHSSEILRRQADGNWRYAIDIP